MMTMTRRSHFQEGKMLSTFLIFILFFFFLFLETPVTGEAMINPIVEFSSREELVDIAGYGEEKLSTVTISGKLLCHACDNNIHHHHAKNELAVIIPAANPVSGASVAVFCGTSGKSKKSWARGTTDEYGDFLIDLPSHLHAIPNLEKVCLLKVLRLPNNSACRPAFTGKHKAIKLLYVEDGARAYTTSTIHLTTKPSKKCKNIMARKRKATRNIY
ncbi:hypothetical protein ACH5RR_014646 [Cinchona calisaya]|uniref:Pollen Ole e 1 allergen and extensin family protein n=1 Tax=Cinchona calisaya TaxID=153742 RepID=A0ABD2ZTL7_9GENT